MTLSTLPTCRNRPRLGDGPDWTACQELGDVAQALGIQAIEGPSATGVDEVLAVFVQNLGAGGSASRGGGVAFRGRLGCAAFIAPAGFAAGT